MLDFHIVHLDSFDSSWPNLLLGLVKPNFINSTTHCLTYYFRKQSLNNGPLLLLFYCCLRHLFKSLHLLWPMWRVWEVHVGLGHLEWSPIWSFLACPLLLGLLMGLGFKVHDGHGLGLEHDLGLGVAQAISLIGITSSPPSWIGFVLKSRGLFKAHNNQIWGSTKIKHISTIVMK